MRKDNDTSWEVVSCFSALQRCREFKVLRRLSRLSFFIVTAGRALLLPTVQGRSFLFFALCITLERRERPTLFTDDVLVASL